MPEGPSRFKLVPVKGDRWRNQTVQGHIAAPVVTKSVRLRQRTRHRDPEHGSARSVQGHISTPVTTQADLSRQKKRRRVVLERPIPVQLLVNDYNRRKVATAHFPPKITARQIRAAMKRYETIIEDARAGVQAACASCGEFSARTALHRIPLGDTRLHPLMASEGRFQLDSCALEDASYGFCAPCFKALHKGKIPKFSALNGVNVTMCQNYPPELEDLTLTEEYAIARSHPIGTILKLKPNGFRNPAAYNAIRGHIVTLPQNPGPLLDILPSPVLKFHEHIKIVWSGKSDPTEEDLKYFVQIRKDKVIQALLWLCEHNPLYASVRINHELLSQWSETFIPSVLQESLARIPEDEDSKQRGTYCGRHGRQFRK
jgi:hypothetical protein